MRKTYGIVCLLLLWIVTTGHAQRIIRGVVQAASDKAGLPGVTVLVKGTETGASTDIQGNFQLFSSRDTVVLVFSFVGFKPLEKRIIIKQDTITLTIYLKEDCTLDYFNSKHIEFAFLSGLCYTQLGGRIKALYPYLFHTQYGQGHLRAEASHQFGGGNYQRNGKLAIDNALIDCDTNMDVTVDYQSVQLGEQKFSFTRYTAGFTYNGKLISQNVPVYLGFGKLHYVAEGNAASKAGLEVGVGYPFLIHLNKSYTSSLQITTTSRIAWWQDYWQFQSSIETQIRRFTAKINFNKIGQYAEINTGVGFRIERRYRMKKVHY